MKQVLCILLFLSLFSFLIADVKRCAPNLVMACRDFKIYSCNCAPKNAKGNFAIVTSCPFPKRAYCEGSGNSLNCRCN